MTGFSPSTRAFAAGLLAILLVGASLRVLFPTADPPWRTTVGVVWHDEGAWTHNARNRALFGAWRLDAWNPMFIAPVFTALEYGAFATFGVGTWQARTVSQAAGLVAVLLIGLGVARLGGRTAGLIAAAWLATNYVYVMYDRAAIMESTMAAFVVMGWYGLVRAQRAPVWGLWAGTAALLAFFTKAAAAFFVAALVLTCIWSLLEAADADADRRERHPLHPPGPPLPLDARARAAARGIGGSAPDAHDGRGGREADRERDEYSGRIAHGERDAHGGRGEPDAPSFRPWPRRSDEPFGVGRGGRRRLHFSRLFRLSTYRLTASAGANDAERARAAAVWTLAGLALAGVVALVAFVGPWWSEYRFYNWQMSVTRKPAYDLRSILDRVTWLPILHDVFTRMWFVWVVGLIAWLGRLTRWVDLDPPERLLTLWVGIGGAELLIHDVGNERRFVFLIPALVALSALALARDRRLLPPAIALAPRTTALIALPVVLYLAYLALGALARLAFIYEVRPNVRLAAWLALVTTALIYATWPRIPRLLSAATFTPRAVAIVAVLVVAGNLIQFTQWAAGRTYANVEASRALGERLPPGTLVHGKLANGLALENRIRPIFVGRQFGNYDDRLTRDDVPYVLTYVEPYEGYEGPVILDVLRAYPQRRTIWTFDVRESTGGHDRAALIVKGPPAAPVSQATIREND